MQKKIIISLLASCYLLISVAAKGPNILFIFSDDHAEAAISAYGSHLAKSAPTPNLDRIAKEGAIFKNSFCANSICGPSRACILTGLHSHTNGFLDNNNSRFDGTQTTFPQLVQKEGYQTAMIGKWHLVSNPTGFNYWEILPGQGAYYNPDFIQMDNSRKRYQGYCTDIITDLALEWLKNEREKDKPFVLMCQHKAPHRNWSPAPRHLNLFDDIKMPEPDTLFDRYGGNRSRTLKEHEMGIKDHMYWGHDMKFHGKESMFPKYFLSGIINRQYERMTDSQKKQWDTAYGPKNEKLINDIKSGKLNEKEITQWKYQRYIKDYLRCIKAVDENVGRLLDYLDDSGLAEDTIVIYSSDQGFYLGEHGWYDKRWMFEESLAMPFLIRWPGVIPAGVESKTLIQNIDYAPTFLELAGATIPKRMHGRSLVNAFKDPLKKPKDWRKSIYYAYYGERTHRVAKHDGIRTDRHKLIHFPNTKEWNLFDLEKDPKEMNSVHKDPQYSNILTSLKKTYTEKKKKYALNNATVPVPRLDQEWWRNRHREKVKLANKGNYELLFLGDSITHGWENAGKTVFNKYYNKRKTLNLGFSGDRTEHVLWRLLNGELATNLNPKVATIMIGTNNTGHSMQNAEETFLGIKAIVDLLQDRRPKMKILLLGIFPRATNPEHPQRIRNNEINSLAKTLADSKNIHYLDISTRLLDEKKNLPKSVMPDALHPNEQGYKIWAKAMEDKICELGGWEKIQ
ncbi:MAG: sulfatase/phosphatase domain-containing protein [Verrucomicrobiota bacterium]|nr:sulfatase/phosphatase domain-containing protein [Verrucomicrobiota bacterium]